VSAFPYFPYGYPSCLWEEAHWENLVLVDKFGNTTYLPQWVPGHWVCLDGDT
jgi:hypothetical protein